MSNLDTPVWSNDGKNVCHMGRPVRGADPETFEVLLGNYAHDARSVFFGSTKSPIIKRASFRVLNANFGVDASKAYFVVTPIRNADPKTFRVLDSSLVAMPAPGSFLRAGYATDAKSVWFASGSGIFQIKPADCRTFVSLGNRFGHDCKRVYFEHTVLQGADCQTWRPWRGNLSIDKNSVFFTNKRMDDVDRASIQLLTYDDCFMDRHRIYWGYNPISPKDYLERLQSAERSLAGERAALRNNKIFDCLFDEWPHEI